jgi:hypothetical protein
MKMKEKHQPSEAAKRALKAQLAHNAWVAKQKDSNSPEVMGRLQKAVEPMDAVYAPARGKKGFFPFTKKRRKHNAAVTQVNRDVDYINENLLHRRALATVNLLDAVDRLETLLAAKDLGYTYAEIEPIGSSDYRTKRQYPTLYIQGIADDIELPEKGKAVIEYRIASKTINEEGDKKRVSYSLEVRSIDPVDDKD